VGAENTTAGDNAMGNFDRLDSRVKASTRYTVNNTVMSGVIEGGNLDENTG